MPAEHQAADRIEFDEAAARTFTATVTAIREVARVDGKQVWQIALDRTAFRVGDSGVLTVISRSGKSMDAPITDVEVDATGETWHTTGKPLQEDTAVTGRVHSA